MSIVLLDAVAVVVEPVRLACQVVMLWSSRFALTTKTETPSGGVSSPTSMAITVITDQHRS